MGIARTPEMLPMLICRAVIYTKDKRTAPLFDSDSFSIYCHSAWYRAVREIWHLHHVWFFVLAFYLPTRNVWLKSFPEIHCAHDGVDDCDDDQNNGDDSKSCE